MSLHHPPFDLQTSKASKAAVKVADVLHGAGFQAVLAGGAVRDLLLGQSPKDFDIATDAHPEAVLKLFKYTKKVGIAFGVILVGDFGETIEVATFRSDLEYKDGRRPEGVVFTDAEHDALRRDFTINGLFYDLKTEQVIDHVDGVADLQQGVIRAIREPSLRFGEDYLRMLRAIRFAVRLKFEIDRGTWVSLQEHAHHLADIAPDRVHEELLKTFSHGEPDRAIGLLRDSGLLAVFLPQAEYDYELPEVSQHVSGGDLVGFLALHLLHMRDKEKLMALLEGLRCTNPVKAEVSKLVKTFSQFNGYESGTLAERKRRLRGHRPEHLFFICERSLKHRHLLEVIERDLLRWPEQQLYPSFLPQGKDLIKAGVKPGPDMGVILYEIETLVLDQVITTREQADTWLLERLKNSVEMKPD